MDDVEIVVPFAQEPAGPEAERQRLGETGRAHDPELQQVDPVAELTRMGDPEGVVRAVEVEARNLDQRDVGGQLGVRLAGQDLDVMAEGGQFPAEVMDIDALPAAVRVAAVGEHGDSQRPVSARLPRPPRHEREPVENLTARSNGRDRDRYERRDSASMCCGEWAAPPIVTRRALALSATGMASVSTPWS